MIVNHIDFLYSPNEHSLVSTTGDKDFRDVTGLLWKSCFYKQIVEFRSSLRKRAADLDSIGLQLQSGLSGRGERHAARDLEELRQREQNERLYVARLTQAFLAFLSDSIAFYQKMMAEVRQHHFWLLLCSHAVIL